MNVASNGTTCKRIANLHHLPKGQYCYKKKLPSHASYSCNHAIDLTIGWEPSNRDDAHILIVVDVYTHFVFIHVLKDKTAAGVVRHLFDLFCFIGFPKIFDVIILESSQTNYSRRSYKN